MGLIMSWISIITAFLLLTTLVFEHGWGAWWTGLAVFLLGAIYATAILMDIGWRKP